MSPRRLLVVSHPAVLAVNQLPYVELAAYGWEPWLVVPATWHDEYAQAPFAPQVAAGLEGRVLGRRVVLPGRPQRHAYVARIGTLVKRLAPAAAFVEQEPTSLPGWQWGAMLHRAGVPFGLQADENLDRHYPRAAREFRRRNLQRASFVAARSPTAAALVRRYRSAMATPVIPHHVPAWTPADRAPSDAFTIGYAGRLVPQKGLDVLIDAAAGVDGARVLLVGDGPSRAALEGQARAAGVDLVVDDTVTHAEMAAAYARFDVLVLPSRTTPTWVEQFGRVLVEAMCCGVPVVGSDSGEIPWVIETTGGGLVVREGDAVALRAALTRLRDDPAQRRVLAARGGARAEELFSVAAVARGLHDALTHATGGAVTSTPQVGHTSPAHGY